MKMQILKSNNLMINLIKGCLISLVFTIIMLVILSILLVYTDISEDIIKPVIITITGIGILIGSSAGTRKAKLIGGIYILLLYFISSIVNRDFTLNLLSCIMIGVGIVGGVIGGIIGVNTK